MWLLVVAIAITPRQSGIRTCYVLRLYSDNEKPVNHRKVRTVAIKNEWAKHSKISRHKKLRVSVTNQPSYDVKEQTRLIRTMCTARNDNKTSIAKVARRLVNCSSARTGGYDMLP